MLHHSCSLRSSHGANLRESCLPSIHVPGKALAPTHKQRQVPGWGRGARRWHLVAAKQDVGARLQQYRERREDHCAGCGIMLQTFEPEMVGYIEPKTFTGRKKFQQVLCSRCEKLRSGLMVPGVEDLEQRKQREAAAKRDPLLQYQLTKPLLCAEDIKQRLEFLRHRYAFAVLLVDLTDVGGTLLAGIRDVVGNSPLLLVGTKADLLPGRWEPDQVVEWLRQLAGLRALQPLELMLASSHTGAGLQGVADAIELHRQGRDVYFLGAANVGKSAFVRSLLDLLGSSGRLHDGGSKGRQRPGQGQPQVLPTESAMPGTTLDVIPVAGFHSGGLIFDTPGLHIAHRATHLLSPAELSLLHPTTPLLGHPAPTPPPAPSSTATSTGAPAPSKSRPSHAAQRHPPPCSAVGTYYWGSLARVDVLQGPPGLQLVFHSPACLPVVALPLQPAEAKTVTTWQILEQQQQQQQQAVAGAEAGAQPVAPGSSDASQQMQEAGAAPAAAAPAAQAIAARPLRLKWEKELQPEGPGDRCIGDVSISGVHGWLALHVQGPWSVPVRLRAWAPRPVEAFLRYPLPLDSAHGQDAALGQASTGVGGDSWGGQTRSRQVDARAASGSARYVDGEDEGFDSWPDGAGYLDDGDYSDWEDMPGGSSSSGSSSSSAGAGDAWLPAGRQPRAAGPAGGLQSSWDPFTNAFDDVLGDDEVDKDLAMFGLDEIYSADKASNPRAPSSGAGRGGRGGGKAGGSTGRGGQSAGRGSRGGRGDRGGRGGRGGRGSRDANARGGR